MKSEERKPKVVGYARVSTTHQDPERQKACIYEYANAKGWTVDRIIDVKASSGKGDKVRNIDNLRSLVKEGEADVLIFAELSRLARSVGQIARLVAEFIGYGVELHFVKEGMQLRQGKRDLSAKVMLTMFSLFAEIERDLLIERTTDGLAVVKAKGVKLGRPKGTSKLDPHEDQIREWRQLGVTQRAMARKLGCTEATICNWLKQKGKEWLRASRPRRSG